VCGFEGVRAKRGNWILVLNEKVGGGGVISVDYWQSRCADQRAAIVLSLANMLITA